LNPIYRLLFHSTTPELSRAKAARPVVLLFILFLLVLGTTTAQDQLSVPIDDPVYSLLRFCSIKGVIPSLSAVKPYSNRTVRQLLSIALANEKSLTPRERSILREIYQELQEDASTTKRFEAGGEAELRTSLEAHVNVHTVNMIKGALKGTIVPSLAYNLNFGIFFDKVDPEAFAPYDFTKKWDGFHIWADDGNVLTSDGINDYLSFSYNTLPELYLDLFDSRIILQLARVRRQWGVGEGSLSLSGTARPIEAFGGSVQTGSRWKFHFLTGSLGNWQDKFHEQKMFSIHRLELFPIDWLYLSAWESVVWAKRFEISYMNPIMSYYMGQQIGGNLDNLAYGGDIAVTISPYVRFYFSLFIDEMALTRLSEFFERVRNQYAWQTGCDASIPWLPFGMLTFQYTKIEPYCYTHYPQELSQYTEPININFSHDGENIGYHLPPNSDEFLLRFSSHPVSGMSLAVQYQLIRHGDGDHTAGQVEGDIDTWIDYSELPLYPPKDFLHDGIYEWINILKLSLTYAFPEAPVRVWGEYSFVHARNYRNITGNTAIMNLVGLGVEVEYTRLTRTHRRSDSEDSNE
jgi:hypothetical protein